MRAREAELKRMDKDKELPVVVRLFCGGLAGGISQTGKSGFPQTGNLLLLFMFFHELVSHEFLKLIGQVFHSGCLKS